MSDWFLGEIRLVSFHFAPSGWLQANGQKLSLQQHAALALLYGNTFGGDGQSFFQIPDLQGRVALGAGSSYRQGRTGGMEAVALTMAEMPAHLHTVPIQTAQGSSSSAKSKYFASVKQTPTSPMVNPYQNRSSTKNMIALTPTSVSQSNPGGQVAVGASIAHENMQPFLTLNFLVAVTGYWPSRP